MRIKRNGVYQNFSGSKRIRVVDMFKDPKDGVYKVVLADMRPPGGWSTISQAEFSKTFSEEVSNGPAEERPKTGDPFYREHRDQADNPYTPLGKAAKAK